MGRNACISQNSDAVLSQQNPGELDHTQNFKNCESPNFSLQNYNSKDHFLFREWMGLHWGLDLGVQEKFRI